MEYGQFCPIAKAAEVLGEKWTILILRELLYGSSRFNDFQNAISGISPTMLTKRLRELEIKGVVVKDEHDYRLTEAGLELAPLIRQYAIWGMRWARGEMPEAELDAQLLMYDLRRRIKTEFLPPAGCTIHVHFTDQDSAEHWWLVYDGAELHLLDSAPEGDDDLLMEAHLRDLTQLWLGDISLRHALVRQLLKLRGRPLIIRCIEDWLPLARQAAIRPAVQVPRKLDPALVALQPTDKQAVAAEEPVAETKPTRSPKKPAKKKAAAKKTPAKRKAAAKKAPAKKKASAKKKSPAKQSTPTKKK